MRKVFKPLSRGPIIYITRDLERALPLVNLKGSCIITNSSPFAKKIAEKNDGIFLISKNKILDTLELLQTPEVKKFIDSKKPSGLLVFKNTTAIEKTCSSNNWRLLNPPAVFASKIEEKISQIEWLGNLKKYLPPFELITGSELKFNKQPFIVQFNRAHTGEGTMLIDSSDKASKISALFPKRPIRKTVFVEGPVFTSNIVVTDTNVMYGPISYQITGLHPFTQNPFATIGNDWALPKKILSKKEFHSIHEIAKAVGNKLHHDRWLGLFGIDVILDINKHQIYLLEINARQPASTTFESELQKSKKGHTTFETHLRALQKIKPISNIKQITDGAQIILRVPAKGSVKNLEKLAQILLKNSYKTIKYQNKTPGSDLLRIMSKKGIMLAHNELNKHGKKIENIIKKYG